MEIARPHPEDVRKPSRLGAFAADIGPKLLVTAIAALITALLIPSITGKWQDHKKQLELWTSLGQDMSRSYTKAIVTGHLSKSCGSEMDVAPASRERRYVASMSSVLT